MWFSHCSAMRTDQPTIGCAAFFFSSVRSKTPERGV
jgi:hypothetical protein